MEIQLHERKSGEIKLKQKRSKRRERIRLTRDDLRALSWITEQVTINLSHLGEWLTIHTALSGSRDSAREKMRRWRAVGLIESAKLLEDQPPYLWLSRQGIAQLDLPFGYMRPTLGQLRHYDATNRVRLLLEAKHGSALGWISDRELRLQGRGRRGHSADACVHLHDTRTAIEIELSKKRIDRLDRILTQLIEEYDYVDYFCGSEAVWRHVQRRAERFDPQTQKMTLHRLSDLP